MSVEYLMQIILPDGSFIYQINAKTLKRSSKYNILRHAGTIMEICVWLKCNPDYIPSPRFEKSLFFLLSHTKLWEETLCVVEDNQVKLGGTALALLATIEYHEYRPNVIPLDLMEGLAQFIIKCQNLDGSFISKFSYIGNRVSTFQSNYYPGQAILALIKYYKITNNKTWLDFGEKSAMYYAANIDSIKMGDKAIAAWYAKSFSELLKISNNFIIQRKLSEIVESNLKSLYALKTDGKLNLDRFTSASLSSLGEALIAGQKIFQAETTPYSLTELVC